MMRHRVVATFAALLLGASAAQAQIFLDDFERPRIAPLFPEQNGNFVLPPGPASTQLQWLLSELAAGETTTIAEINQRFDPTWLSQINATQTQSFIQSVRSAYPNARITDVVSVTPMRITALIDSPGSPLPSGFLTFGTRYVSPSGIVQFGVNSFSSAMFPADTTLTLGQAADKYLTLSAQPSLFIGRINASGQCVRTVSCSTPADCHAETRRATASVFKTWALAGAARRLANGTLLPNESFTLDGTRNVSGSVITSEPNGTVFPLRDLLTMMMGNSDNTATDMTLARVGRPFLNQTLIDTGMATPAAMTPLLGISETFHLIFSFQPATIQAYIDGSQNDRELFLTNSIVPLGRFTSASFNNASFLSTASWRATPADVCRAFAALRKLPKGSDALREADFAFGAQAALPLVRNQWDRVWYKGGSLARATNTFDVYTYAWLLEDAGRDPFVVVALANSPTGAINLDPQVFQMQSVLARVLELLAADPS
jgi:hypothetical protein